MRYEITITYKDNESVTYTALEIDQNFYEINIKLGEGDMVTLPKNDIRGIRIKEL